MRFKKVIVINLPSPPGYVVNRDSMGGFGQLYPPGATIFPPLDVPYLAAYLVQNGISSEVIEAQGLDLDREQLVNRVAKIAKENQPGHTLVVARVALCSLDWDLSVCSAIKVGTRGVALAIYGPVVPQVQERVRREYSLDYIIQGEPDEGVYELAVGHPIEEILGLNYRSGENWTERPPRPFLNDLDQLPFPKWELLPFQRYILPKSSATASVPFLPMLTSRGCPFGCHYCPYPVAQGLPFRFRSSENVVDEIEHLVKNLGIRYIIFRDPMFSFRLDRVVEICNEIQRRGLKFKWKCETRIDSLDESTLRAMVTAGCEGVNFGVESADIGIQASAGRKPISVIKITEMVALCRKLGVKTFCFFIIGLPGDTVNTILQTIAFGIRLRSSWVQFTAASPFIGTKLREWAVARGLTTRDEYAYINSHEAVMGNENLTKIQIQALVRFAKFFEQYVINRKGILKDANRKGLLYSSGRSTADLICDFVGKIAFALGRRYFERAYSPGPETQLAQQ